MRDKRKKVRSIVAETKCAYLVGAAICRPLAYMINLFIYKRAADCRPYIFKKVHANNRLVNNRKYKIVK